jgi:amino acid adenylation domain-containing protein/thioester reductase-like protein
MDIQAEIREGFRLSPQQEHLWSLQECTRNSVYRSDCVISITGNLDLERLQLALQTVVARHEILRTCFCCLPGMTIPVQVITNNQVTLAPRYDLSDCSAEKQKAKLQTIIENLKCLPFDLEKGLVLQTALISLSQQEHLLYVSFPAICGDAVSLHNFMAEIASAYSGKLDDELSEGTLQYADFSEWHNQILVAEETEIGRKYWLQKNLSIIDVFQLPYEIDNPNYKEFEPKVIEFLIENDVGRKIESISKQYNSCSAVFFLTCWQIWLWRSLQQSEIVVGVGVDGRKYDELKNALGLFAKYLPLTCHLEANLTFVEICQQVNKSIQEINKWQECFSWEQIDNSSTKLTYLPFGFDWEQKAGICYAENLKFTMLEQFSCLERFQIQLSCQQLAESFHYKFYYDSNLFQVESMELIAEQFHQLLVSVVNNPQEIIGKLNILSDRARHQLLFEFNQTEVNFPQNQCIHLSFAEQAERTPNNIAVVFNGQQLTYAELNARANQLAHYLQNLGVGAETLVGIYVERSSEMLVGILGILKAGGAYVPLDPHYPRERLALILEDIQLSVLLTQQHLLQSLPEYNAQTICLDTDWKTIALQSQENPLLTTTPENLAYVIYTSGSTGKPKGVAIAHCNLVHSTNARILYYRESVSNFLLLSSFAFDSSIAGIFWTLCSGGTLHLPEEGAQREVPKLVELISQNRVSHLLSLPSLYALILQQAKPEQLNSLRTVIVAGEACPPQLVQYHSQLYPETSLFNEYGPTEATVWSSVYHCYSQKTKTRVPIGNPIANTQIYILDSDLHPVPVGVPGEIYIGGEGLARGYFNQPEITSEKFIPHPFSQKPGMRLYKTGDLGRYLPDGNIEFLGRIDNQVKIRGFRIELGEIEALLNQHSQVQETVAIAREDAPGQKRLVAYVVPQLKSAIAANELRNFLTERLPEFMVPSAIVFLKELPLNPNGKVDRKALPAPEQFASDFLETFVPPRTPVEEILAQIWAEVLKVDKVGINDDFFELGGHSLLTTQLLFKVKEAFNLDIYLGSFLEKPTVAGLAEKIVQFGQLEVPCQTLNIKSESALDPIIFPPNLGQFISKPKAILLTGPTGFLGAFLLAELLQITKANIYCLVRSSSLEDAWSKLKTSLQSYQIWNENFSSRIIPILGDLTKPLLNLKSETFHQLASTIDVIYHNGAWVNHIYPYFILKPANVLGTQEILRLASQIKTKPVHFISSSGVVGSKVESGVKLVREQDNLDENEFPNNGYCQTKWIAEKLVQTAAQRGIPVCIYRPSRISGHSQTGVFNSNDFLYKLIISCVQLKSVPDVDIRENIVPVDYVSKAIVYLSQQEESLGKTFHLVHSQTLHSHTLIEYIRSLGYRIEQIPYRHWREKLLKITQEYLEHPLYSLVPFFPEFPQHNSGLLQLDNQNVIKGLLNTSITCPSIDGQLLKVYFDYLGNKGFLSNLSSDNNFLL